MAAASSSSSSSSSSVIKDDTLLERLSSLRKHLYDSELEVTVPIHRGDRTHVSVVTAVGEDGLTLPPISTMVDLDSLIVFDGFPFRAVSLRDGDPKRLVADPSAVFQLFHVAKERGERTSVIMGRVTPISGDSITVYNADKAVTVEWPSSVYQLQLLEKPRQTTLGKTAFYFQGASAGTARLFYADPNTLNALPKYDAQYNFSSSTVSIQLGVIISNSSSVRYTKINPLNVASRTSKPARQPQLESDDISILGLRDMPSSTSFARSKTASSSVVASTPPGKKANKRVVILGPIDIDPYSQTKVISWHVSDIPSKMLYYHFTHDGPNPTPWLWIKGLDPSIYTLFDGQFTLISELVAGSKEYFGSGLFQVHQRSARDKRSDVFVIKFPAVDNISVVHKKSSATKNDDERTRTDNYTYLLENRRDGNTVVRLVVQLPRNGNPELKTDDDHDHDGKGFVDYEPIPGDSVRHDLRQMDVDMSGKQRLTIKYSITTRQ